MVYNTMAINVDYQDANYVAGLNNLARQKAETSRLARQFGTPEPLITGGSGDPDIRRFYTPPLIYNIPVQRGFNGLQCGGTAINMEGRVYPDTTPITEMQCGVSRWGNTKVEGSKAVYPMQLQINPATPYERVTVGYVEMGVCDSGFPNDPDYGTGAPPCWPFNPFNP